MQDWLPRSVSSLGDYSWQKFASDGVAGVTVGLVALSTTTAPEIAATPCWQPQVSTSDNCSAT